MTEIHAHVRYTEPMLRQAVRVFMWRRVLRRPKLVLLAVLLLTTSVTLAILDGPDFFTGVTTALLAFLALFLLFLWRAHLKNTVGRYHAMDPPEADLLFTASSFTATSNLGTTTLPWSTFTEVWELPGFWMIFHAEAQFLTLPLETLEPETLAFLRARLPQPP